MSCILKWTETRRRRRQLRSCQLVHGCRSRRRSRPVGIISIDRCWPVAMSQPPACLHVVWKCGVQFWYCDVQRNGNQSVRRDGDVDERWWRGGLSLRRRNRYSRSQVRLSAMTLLGYFWDRWPSFACKLALGVTTIQVNSAVHPSKVGWSKSGKLPLPGGR